MYRLEITQDGSYEIILSVKDTLTHCVNHAADFLEDRVKHDREKFKVSNYTVKFQFIGDK